MDELADFLPEAKWRQLGHHTSICDDERLEPKWIKFASEGPSFLKGCGLQAWKTTGDTKVVEEAAYIIPVRVIEGYPQIKGGPSLMPGSSPFYFEGEAMISGSLFYVLALPPVTKHSENQARS